MIAFEPLFLASALEIGPELRLIDAMNPGLTAAPSGAFCVLMPLRCEAAAVMAARPTSQEPQQEATPAAPEAIAA